MNIQNNIYQSQTHSVTTGIKSEKKINNNIETQPVLKDEYVVSGKENKVTYSKPDMVNVERLKKESEAVYNNLRELVRQLLARQGLEFNDLGSFKGDIKIDDETRTKAQEAIAEGGYMSPENVSDRIVNFAKAISGGDKSKLGVLRDSIEKGFEEARKAWGGDLPDITNKTHQLIFEKLDAWENE